MPDENEVTLSVCLVISWPPPHLIARLPSTNPPAKPCEVLLISLKLLSDQVSAGRSRIEDGQFVGWLSYPSVMAAQDAFLVLRDAPQLELTVKLQTIDERIPLAWQRASGEASHVRGTLSQAKVICEQGSGLR